MSDRAPQQQTSATPVSTPAQSHALPTQTLDTADSAYLDYSAPIQAKMRPFGPQPVDSPFAKSSHPLAPRPFILPNPTQATRPSLQAQLKHAEKFGNSLVPNLATPIQTKLTVGAPGDRYEQEADRVAEQVMSMPDAAIQQPVQREAMPEEDELQTKPLAAAITPLVQREAMPEEEEVQTKAIGTLQREEMPEEEELQMKPIGMLQREEAMPEEEEVQAKPLGNSIQREAMPEEEELQAKPLGNEMLQREAMPEEEEAVQAKGAPDAALPAGSNLESRLSSSQGSGSPLSNDVRSFMEPRFGADFSQVRVHTCSESVQMNRDLNAQAFTHKQDVYFGAGKSPGKNDLTAHELTHVVQQTQPQVRLSAAKSDAIVQRKQENEAPLAAIQGLAMYDLLPKLEALSSAVRTDEEAGGFVSGPRLVIAMRAVKTKFDKDLVDFLSINKKGLESLPPDQYGDILRYLGASDNIPESNKGTANSSASVSQLSTTDKFSEAVKRAMKELPGETANRLEELLTPQSIAVMVSFTAVYIASQVTPAGWVADGIGIALILASAVMIGPEVVTIVEHIIAFAQKASNATNDQDLDSAGHDLALAVTKIGVDVVMAILLHKAGKSGTKAVKTYVKPAPALVDAVTLDGRVVRVPAEEVSKSTYESRGSGKGGGKVSLVDAIRSIGDDFLDQSEGRGGGHTISEHVSRTNQELVRRAVKENVDATSFDNKSGATAAVRYNLRTNAADIAAWLEDTNAANRRPFDASHPMRIGRGVKAGSKTINYDIGDSRIVLVKDATMPLKFRILTGFPLLQP